jgi:protein gp37
LYACGANKHGKPRSKEDKRRAVDRLLTDPEWQAKGLRWIASHCGVAVSFVHKRASVLKEQMDKPAVREVQRGGTTYRMDTSRIGRGEVPPSGEPAVTGVPEGEASAGAELPPADDLDRAAIKSRFPPREPELKVSKGANEAAHAQGCTPPSPPVLGVQEPRVILASVDFDLGCPVEPPALILTSPDVDLPPAKRPTFNRTNQMVDWAWWTWNPVTGCLHDCSYCYARVIAERFYPEKFEPTFHPDRLKAPHYTKVPPDASHDVRAKSVFVCSMADLFGKWVPQAWIDAVLAEVRAAPQWNFLFLTKFPQRLAEIDWPDNAWVGTTVDEQYRVKIAEKAFRDLKAPVRWLSCEPMRERLTFESLEMFDWVVVGGQSAAGSEPAMQPLWEWVLHLENQARQANCRVFWKQNLTVRPREYPGMPGMGQDRC